MKQPKLQTLMTDFSDRIGRLVEDEILHNKGLIDAYLTYPRPEEAMKGGFAKKSQKELLPKVSE